jgi:hypothetical protein
LTTSVRIFRRKVTAFVERTEARGRHETLRETLSEKEWLHSDPDTPAPPLSMDIRAPGVADWFIELDDGDNPALPLGPTRLELPAFRARFFREQGSDLTLFYGRSDLSAPRYDLTLLAPRLVGAAAEELSLESERPNAEPSPAPIGLQNKVFWGVLIGAVLVLIGFIAVLLRKAEPAA